MNPTLQLALTILIVELLLMLPVLFVKAMMR